MMAKSEREESIVSLSFRFWFVSFFRWCSFNILIPKVHDFHHHILRECQHIRVRRNWCNDVTTNTRVTFTCRKFVFAPKCRGIAAKRVSEAVRAATKQWPSEINRSVRTWPGTRVTCSCCIVLCVISCSDY